MSFTGLFIAKDGLIGIVDSKASQKTDTGLTEDTSRNPEKMFVFSDGIALTYGQNQFLLQNSNQLFSKKINIEDYVFEYLAHHPTLDCSFFQNLLLDMGSNSSNVEPIYFLVGRKIRTGEYRLERHRITFHTYAQQIATSKDLYFVGGSDLYEQAFLQLDYTPYLNSSENLRTFIVNQLDSFIDFYDKHLPYNPVGKSIKSYILQ